MGAVGSRERALKGSAACLGWGLLTAWGLVGMGAVGLPGLFGTPAVGLATGVVNMAGMLLVALAAAPLRVWRARRGGAAADGSGLRAVAGVGGALSCIGCAAALVGSGAGLPTGALVALMAVSSVGYVVLLCGWLVAYRALEVGEAESLSMLSTAACALVCLVALLLPGPAAAALWVCLPAASAWCLWLRAPLETSEDAREPGPPGGGGDAAGTSSGRRAVLGGRGERLAHALCAIGVGVGSLALVAPTSPSLGAPVPVGEAYAQLSGLALSVILVLYCTVYARRVALPQFFKVLYPLAVAGLWLFSGVSGETLRFLGLCLLSAAQWVLYLFIWLYALESVGSRADTDCAASPCPAGLRALAVYALLRAAFETGFLVSGVLACMQPPIAVDQTGAGLPGICFAAAALFILTIVLPLEGPSEAASPGGAGDGMLPAPDARAATAGRSAAELLGLSPRESEILAYLRRGYSFVAIRNELYISKGTVDTYVRRIYRKCEVHSRQELVELCERVERGEPDEPDARAGRG